MIFKVDNVEYPNIKVLRGSILLRRIIEEGENAGKFQNGDIYSEVSGTRYEYEMTISPRFSSIQEYQALLDVLDTPVETHSVTMPFNQTTITFDAKVKTFETPLENMVNGNKWSDTKIIFTSKSLNKIAGE